MTDYIDREVLLDYLAESYAGCPKLRKYVNSMPSVSVDVQGNRYEAALKAIALLTSDQFDMAWQIATNALNNMEIPNSSNHSEKPDSSTQQLKRDELREYVNTVRKENPMCGKLIDAMESIAARLEKLEAQKGGE